LGVKIIYNFGALLNNFSTMYSSSNFEKLLGDIELIFATEKNMDHSIELAMLHFQSALICDTVALFHTFNNLGGQIQEKFELHGNGEYLYWPSVKNEFRALLIIGKDDFFDFTMGQEHIYCFEIKSYGWLVLVKTVPFPDNYIPQLKIMFNYFERLSRKLLNETNVREIENYLVPDGLHKIFLNIIENSSESILISDAEGSLIFANNKSRKWLGIEGFNFKGVKVYDYEKYFEGDIIKNWKRHVQQLRKMGPQRNRGSLKNLKNGAVVNTEVLIKHLVYGEQEYVLAISKDATEKEKLREIIFKESSLQEILLKMASIYINIEVSEINSIINTSLKEICEFVGADRSYIFSYNFIDGTTSNTFEWCVEGVVPEIENLQEVPISFLPEWLECHNKGLPFIIPDVSELPDTGPNGIKAILEPQGVKSLITLPMFNKHRLIGFVGFDSVKIKKIYSKREERLLFVYAEILVNMDLRQQYELELIQQKERFRKIIGSIELGLVEINSEFEIIFTNQSFMEFYDYQSQELLGKNLFEIFLQNEDGICLQEKMTRLKNKEALTQELATLDSGGNDKIVLSSIVKYGEGEISAGYLCAIVDLTYQKEMEKKLRESLSKIEQASRAKEQFFANMSHELRTPLNIINGTLAEVSKQKISKDTYFLVDQASIASRHMLNLVNNILDFAKINAGEIKFERKEFYLNKMILETFEVFKLMASDKEIEYSLTIDDRIHEYVAGDYGKMNQVLINLIGNAIKFTDKGKVCLTVDLLTDDISSQIISFTVADTGVGMDKLFLEEIFEEYQQDILVNNLQSGTGLGMPISKKLVNFMGGSIAVYSEKNKGTSVVFDLSLDKLKTPFYAKEISYNINLLKNKLILIVEDNYMNALILERKISGLGAKIVKVENGQLALEAMRSERFDLIFMDIQMPVLDGLQATKIIRQELGSNVPIIAVTANAFKNNLEEYIAAGMNDFLIKPFDDHVLFSKTLNLLNPIIFIDQKAKGIYSLESVTLANEYDLKSLKTLSNGDEDFYQEMLNVFVDISSKAILELEQSLSSNDLPNVARIVHKIKPSIKDLNIGKVVALIDVLETSGYENIDFVKTNANALMDTLKSVVDAISENEL